MSVNPGLTSEAGLSDDGGTVLTAPTRATRRLDFAPIERYCRARWPIDLDNPCPRSDRIQVQDAPVVMLSTVLGVPRAFIFAARRYGLNDRQADLVATRLGLHPSLVWDDWMPVCPRCFAPGTCECERAWRKRVYRVSRRVQAMGEAEREAWMGVERVEEVAA